MIFFLIVSPLFYSPFPLHGPDQAPSDRVSTLKRVEAKEARIMPSYLVTAAVCCLQISRSSNQENYSAGCFLASDILRHSAHPGRMSPIVVSVSKALSRLSFAYPVPGHPSASQHYLGGGTVKSWSM